MISLFNIFFNSFLIIIMLFYIFEDSSLLLSVIMLFERYFNL